MIKSIIVDDEKHSRDTLEKKLELFDQIKVLDTCKNLEEARTAILKHDPDLVFLDIELPGQTGFDLLEGNNRPRWDVIFTTAYEQYALRAIKASALDYLLKPIGEEELSEAIQKHLNKKTEDIHKQVEILLQHYSGSKNGKNKVALPTLNGLEMVNIEDIIRLKADGRYTEFHLSGKRKMLVSKNIKEYEDLLNEHQFMRIHHSHIINLQLVKKYVKGEGGSVILEDGSSIDVSRQKKDELVLTLKKL